MKFSRHPCACPDEQPAQHEYFLPFTCTIVINLKDYAVILEKQNIEHQHLNHSEAPQGKVV